MQVQAANQVSPYRALRAPLCRTFAKYQSPFVSIDVLLSWATNRYSAVTVRQDVRQFGSSNYSFSKLLFHALTMMTGFSTLPLRLASVVGFGFTAFGILMLLYVVGAYFAHGGSVPGFPFLASAIAIFSGAQLFALGIIGEYLGRLYYRVMERPAYVIGETVETREGGCAHVGA
jgi:undecaprenyl-phosphate 4-deoxy-4-formamido-L-arabinose transferase